MSRKWSRFPCQARTRPAPSRNPDVTATAASGLVPRQRGAATSQPLMPAVSRFPWGRRRQARPMSSQRRWSRDANGQPDASRRASNYNGIPQPRRVPISGAAGDDRRDSRKRGSRMPQEVFFGGRSRVSTRRPAFPAAFPFAVLNVSRCGRSEWCERGIARSEARHEPSRLQPQARSSPSLDASRRASNWGGGQL